MNKYVWNEIFNLLIKEKASYKEKLNESNIDEFLNHIIEDEVPILSNLIIYNRGNGIININYNGLKKEVILDLIDDNSIYREAKGLFVNILTEEIIISPMRKFNNLEQYPERYFNSILKYSILYPRKILITEKMDGSLIQCRYYKGKLFVAGTKNIDNYQTKLAEKYLTEDYINLIKSKEDYVFLFELIDNDCPIVVNYSKEKQGLYLIGYRDMKDGLEYSIKSAMMLVYFNYNIKTVKILDISLSDAVDSLKDIKGEEHEGYVVMIGNIRYKLKSPDYIKMHKIIADIDNLNYSYIIDAILDGYYDDLIAKIPYTKRTKIEECFSNVMSYLKYSEDLYMKYVVALPHITIKELIIELDKSDINSFIKYKLIEAKNKSKNVHDFKNIIFIKRNNRISYGNILKILKMDGDN